MKTFAFFIFLPWKTGRRPLKEEKSKRLEKTFLWWMLMHAIMDSDSISKIQPAKGLVFPKNTVHVVNHQCTNYMKIINWYFTHCKKETGCFYHISQTWMPRDNFRPGWPWHLWHRKIALASSPQLRFESCGEKESQVWMVNERMRWMEIYPPWN